MAQQLLKFLKNNGIEQLTTRFNIIIKQSILFPELVCLTYNQLTTPKNKITDDCRGIIINKDLLDIVCYPFTRFHDYNPKIDTGFNKDQFLCYEKIDGSIMSLYYYKGEWRVSTKSTPDAHGKIPLTDYTYAEYFWATWNKLQYKLPGDKNCTYIFEFKFPSDIQFTTKSSVETITLIGIRDLTTFKELPPIRIGHTQGWATPAVNDLDFQSVVDLSMTLNPIVCEGFVVCDLHFQRLKIKSPAYDLINLIRTPKEDTESNAKINKEIQTWNYEKIIQISQVTETTQWLKYYNHCRLDHAIISVAREKFLDQLTIMLVQISDCTPQEIAKLGRDSMFKKHLWQLQKCGNVSKFVRELNKTVYVDYIKQIVIETIM